MIRLKSAAEIETLAAGGALMADILGKLAQEVTPGITPYELDQKARQYIADAGVTAAFLGYDPGGHDPYPAALCVSVNNAVVHGLPTNVALAEGDIVGLDLGIIYKGMYLDSARTVAVGTISAEAQHLMAVTKKALEKGIAAAQPGNTTGDIGYAIEQYVKSEGLFVVRELVGHGVGYAVHEDPKVPNFGPARRGATLNPGLVIAIEPMVTIGSSRVQTAEDGWTVETISGNLSAHEEHTVAILPEGPKILTQ